MSRQPQPTLAGFVAGKNVELVAALNALLAGKPVDQQIHLWGPSGSGRTHLLRAVAQCGVYHDASGDGLPPIFSADVACYAIDNVERLDASGQSALFNLVNAIRGSGATLVTSSHLAPGQLSALREDVRTRLGWGLIFSLHPLDDREKSAAIMRHAEDLGLVMPEDVCRYLLTRFSRDLPSLIGIVDRLDRFAMERQRAVTLPLLREFMAAAEADPQ